jgi:hypothetical protein
MRALSSGSRAALVLALSLSASAIASSPRTVYAKDPSSGELQLAKDMLKDAIAEEKNGKCTEAIAILKQAAAIKESAEILLHMGECQAKTGKLRDALATLEKGQDVAKQEKDKASQQAIATKLEQLRGRVPTVTLKVPSDVSGVSAKIDDEAIASEKLSAPIPLDPGDHTIAVTAEGGKSFSKKVSLAEKDAIEVNVELGSSGGGGTTTAPSSGDKGEDKGGDEPKRSGTIPLGTWIAGSAALALAVGGIVAFAVAGSEASDGEDQCAKQKECDQAAIDSVHQLDTAALALWIGAGIGVGVAVGFYILDQPKGSRDRTGPPATVARPIQSARILVGPGSVGLSGSF